MSNDIESLEKEIVEKKEALARMRRSMPAERVEDHELSDRDGSKRLSDLFGDRSELIVIHNMGKACNYCSLWADGLSAISHHIEQRAALVLVSPDPPEVQAEHARKRGWTLTMVSDQSKQFSAAMGFYSEAEGFYPGVSAFRKNLDGSIDRMSHTWFGPGDDFCAVWPLMDLLPDGPNGWEPS